MMDRNREARRAAAMTNGLQSQRRRHRTASGSLRESPEGDGQMELQETARLRDRTAKKDRDRETRDRDLDLDRDLDRLNRNKRQRGVDKYMHGSSRDDVVSGAGDDSSEESINDEDEDDDDGPFRYVPPSNPVSMSSSSTASTLTHRRSYPPPSKDFRSTGMVPSWKDPEETIAFSVPRKARSSSSKRPHDCWTSGGGGGGAGVVSADQIHRQASSTPVTLNNTAAAPAPSPPPAPVSPSSSTISIRKKIKPNGQKHKPPKACPKSSPSIQDEIEIEVAEVLYGLMRQSQNPSSSKMEVVSNDSAKLDKSTGDSKSVVHSQNSSSAPPSLPTVAPKRKRPRPYQDEDPAAWNSPILPKVDLDQAPKAETPSPSSENNIVGSAVENGDLAISQDPAAAANGVVAEAKALVEELGSRDVRVAVMSAKVEEASLSPKKESQDHNHVESTSTSIKVNSALAEKENHREEKIEIDLMALPPPSRGSPEREGVVEYGGGMMGDETSMVTDRDTEAKATEEDDKKGINNSSSIIRGAEFNVNAGEAEAKAVAAEGEPHKHEPQPPHRHQHDNSKERNIDHQLDLEEPDGSTGVNDHKLNIPLHKQPPQLPPQQSPPKAVKDEANVDNKPGQFSSVQLPMSVAAGWHGGLRPMGFVAPLQGVVSMDGTTMTTAPIQPPQFVFSPPRSKRCATHWCIGKSISNHQQMMKVTPFWPGGAAAAGSAPLLCAKAYNLNMVPSPADLHAAGRAGVNSAQDKTHPYAFFPASKDKSPQTPNAPDSSQKKQFLLPQSIPPGPPNNIVHAPAFFFPFGQQQAAATASARPSTAKSPSTAGNVASTTTSSSAPMGTCSTAGPTMSFSYPNMGGSETQFMAFLGNGPYPFPIPAHVGVGAATPYRGSHPQAMSFFNGSYYSPQMLHPSQLQQQQQQPPPQPAVHSQIQQQNHQNPSLSTTSSSQKHLQNQQQRPQGSGASTAGPSNPNLQNFQAAKGRPSQPSHHDMGCGEDSPSTADSRTRPNLGVYNQSFSLPFHSPNFALMTQSSSIGCGSSNTAGIQNGDKKQQQQQSQQPAYPMSFASMNGVTPPGLDISSMTHNHALLQSLPEPARHNYQMLAAAAQAAQAANPKKNNYQDGKTADPSNAEEERKAMASTASGASVGGQSIAFSRDLANSISTVVDTSSRSLNLVPGSGRPTHSLGSIAATNSGASNSQQQQQMLFPKQHQYVAATVATARSKTPVTSNGNVYPDHLTSASVMAAKFPNSLPSFPPLVQSSGAPSQSPHWKNSVMPNTSQVSSPPIVATSTTSTIKNLPQQQGRTQQNHTQISFGAPATNPKPSTTSQGQQPPNNNRAPSPPMMVGSPSNSSVSKSGCGGNPRTGTSTSLGNKSGGAQASSLSSQQGKNSPSPSPSISSQKPSILGSPHMMMSTSTTGSKPQMQESQHQPPLSKQSIQQTQLFFSNPYMQGSANTLAGGGYYLQRHRAENQHHHQQQQQHVLKSQGSAPPATSSGMLSLRNPVSLGNASTTSDPAKAAAAAHSMKCGDPPQGMFHTAQYAAESAGATHQLVPAGYSYVHAVPTVQVKPAEQKQPAGE